MYAPAAALCIPKSLLDILLRVTRPRWVHSGTVLQVLHIVNTLGLNFQGGLVPARIHELPRETVWKVAGEMPRGHISLARDGKNELSCLVSGAVRHQNGMLLGLSRQSQKRNSRKLSFLLGVFSETQRL